MRRSQTASFVTDLPIVVDSKTEKKLLAKFQAGRQLYNACLTQVSGTAPHQKLASGVGESYSLRSDSSVKQVSMKLGNISQISQAGLKANANS